MAGSKGRAVRRNTNRPPRSERSRRGQKRRGDPLVAVLALIDDTARACRQMACQLTEQMIAIADPLDRNDVARLRDRAEIAADDLTEVRIYLAATGKQVGIPQAEDTTRLKDLERELRKADSNRAARIEAAAQLLAIGKRLAATREPGPTSSPEST